MPISRRKLLAASIATPFVSSCATGRSSDREETVSALAAKLGISATYVTLAAGKLAPTVVLSNSSSRHPVHADSLFQAASLTKPVIAFVALALVREGRLELAAPVSRYLPNGYRHRRNISWDSAAFDLVSADTLARIPVSTLLNHSSGLPNWAGGTLKPGFDAGERWQYSGEAYVLLHAVISAITGQGIDALVEDYVFGPLGMERSRIRLSEEMRDQLVNSTAWLPWTRPIAFAEANAAASLYTTATDYAKFMAYWVKDDALVALTLAKPVSTDPGLGLSWGYGWGIEAAAGGPYLWQWGNNPGYRAFAMISTASGNGFVLLTNSEQGMKLVEPLARTAVPSEHGAFRFHMVG
jgi:CubicO group peptidase (beta-lactamase class C family)